MKNKNLTALIIVLFITGIYFLGKHFIEPKFNENEENPYDLKLDSIGRIDISKFGKYKHTVIKLNLKNPKAITVSDEFIYVSGDSMILITDKNGNPVNEFETAVTATSLRTNNKGNIFAGLKDHIEVFNSEGKLLNKFKSLGDRAYITSLAVNEKNIYAAEAESEFVCVFDHEGNITDIYGDSVPATDIMRLVLPSYFFDVDIGPEGTLWIANTGKHAIINVNENGKVRSYWGSTSAQVEGFCGCCNPTHFCILSDGSFITSEKGIVRVKKYDSFGKFVHVIAGPEQFKENSTGLDIASDQNNLIYILEPAGSIIHVFKEQ